MFYAIGTPPFMLYETPVTHMPYSYRQNRHESLPQPSSNQLRPYLHRMFLSTELPPLLLRIGVVYKWQVTFTFLKRL